MRDGKGGTKGMKRRRGKERGEGKGGPRRLGAWGSRGLIRPWHARRRTGGGTQVLSPPFQWRMMPLHCKEERLYHCRHEGLQPVIHWRQLFVVGRLFSSYSLPSAVYLSATAREHTLRRISQRDRQSTADVRLNKSANGFNGKAKRVVMAAVQVLCCC
jgi:hypothetical protein